MHLNLDNRVATFLGVGLPTLLTICSFCGCLDVIFLIFFPLMLRTECGSDYIFTYSLIYLEVKVLAVT